MDICLDITYIIVCNVNTNLAVIYFESKCKSIVITLQKSAIALYGTSVNFWWW